MQNKYENLQKDLLEILQNGKAIIVLDNDGTIFDSQPSEAWRIRTILSKLGETNLPSLEALLEIGYGKKTWAVGLVKILKDNYPHLSDEILEQLKCKLEQGSVDEIIVQMGQNMIPIPGSESFLLAMSKKGHTLAICSDNYSDAVAEAVNHHIRGIHCLLPDNRDPHHHASKKAKCLGDYLITLNDTFGVNLKGKYKPDPTKLLIQQFKALMNLNVVNSNQLDLFITDSEFRQQLKSHANYRKTIYIGDDVNDYLAAANAHFDYFIATTKCGKCNESQFSCKIESNTFKIKTLMIDNLHMLNEWINKASISIGSECVAQENLIRAGKNSNTFFDSTSVNKQATVQDIMTHSV